MVHMVLPRSQRGQELVGPCCRYDRSHGSGMYFMYTKDSREIVVDKLKEECKDLCQVRLRMSQDVMDEAEAFNG